MPIYPVEKADKNGKKKRVLKDGKQKYIVRVNYSDQYGKAELKKQKPAARLTLKKLFDEYMLSKKNEVRATSYDKTRRILERYVLEKHKDDALAKFNVAAAQHWKQEIEALGIGVTTQQNISANSAPC